MDERIGCGITEAAGSGAKAVALFVVLLVIMLGSGLGALGCASAPVTRSELFEAATFEHPVVACIADSPFAARQLNPITGGRVLPEVVRVGGLTSMEDGQRAKVLRAGETDPGAWQPWPVEKLQTRGCGQEAEAMREAVAWGARGSVESITAAVRP